MSKHHGRNQRRTMMVDRQVQGRMLKRLCLLPAVGLVVMGLVVMVSVVCLLIEVQEAYVVLSSLPLVIWSVALFVGGSAGFLFITSFRFSYRVAGPTYRILKSLEEFQHHGGDFKIQLRAGDELQDLAAKLNEVMREVQPTHGTDTTETKTSSQPELSTASTD